MTTEQLLQHKALNNPKATIALFASYFGGNIAEMAPSGIVNYSKESVAVLDKKGKPVSDESGNAVYEERETPIYQSADAFGITVNNFLQNIFTAIKSGAFSKSGLQLDTPLDFKAKLYEVAYSNRGHSSTLGDEFENQAPTEYKDKIELCAEFGPTALLEIA